MKYLGMIREHKVYEDEKGGVIMDDLRADKGTPVYNDIIRELGIPSHGKGGYNKYFELSRNIHNEVVKKYQELKKTMDSINENHKSIMNDPDITLSAKEQERIYYAKCQDRFKRELESIKKETEERLSTVYMDMVKDVNAFYTPNGADIDTDTLTLINSGIKLNESELDKLLDRFGDNYTMSRLLSDYAARNEIRTDKSILLDEFIRTNKIDKNVELDTITSLHNTTRMAIDDSDPIRAMVRIENYNGIYNGLIEDMNRCPVRVADCEPITAELAD